MAEILVAREPFAFTGKDGVPRIFGAGQEIYSDDPDIKGREHLFEPSGAKLRRASAASASETASAAPGERRTRSTSTPKTDPKGGDDA